MSPEQLNCAESPLEELRQAVDKNARTVSQYLTAHHLPQPSFNDDGPSTFLPTGAPESIQQARQNLISASLELLQLAIGPSEFLSNLATGVRLERSSISKKGEIPAYY